MADEESTGYGKDGDAEVGDGKSESGQNAGDGRYCGDLRDAQDVLLHLCGEKRVTLYRGRRAFS